MDKKEENIKKVLLESKLSVDSLWADRVERGLKEFALSNLETSNTSKSVLTIFKQNIIIFNLINMKKPVLIALSTAVIFTIATTAILSTIFIGQRLNMNSQYSKEETERILTQIIQNNSSTVLAGTQNATLAGSQSLIAEADQSKRSALGSLSLPYQYNDFDGFNYRYTKTENTLGAKFEECNPQDTYSKYYVLTENYEYNPNAKKDPYAYKYLNSKYLTYTAKNELTNYSLNYREGEYNLAYEYMGGNFAVKNLYEIGPDSDYSLYSTLREDISTTEGPTEPINEVALTNPSDLIKQYFGDDVQIIGTSRINNANYYTIRYSIATYCNDKEAKLFVESLVKEGDFTILKNSSYIDSISEANLLSRTKQSFETKTIGAEEAANIFKFEYNVEIRETKYPYIAPEEYNAEKEISKTLNEVKKNGFKVLAPVQGDLKLSSVYTNPYDTTVTSQSDYRTERAFYPNGALGTEMLKLYTYIPVRNIVDILSNWSFASTGITPLNLTINVVKKDVTIDQIIENQTSYSEDKVISTKKIKLDGTNINATSVEYTQVYEYIQDSNYDGIKPTPATSEIASTAPVEGFSPEGVSEVKQSFLVVEFNNFYYIITKDYSINNDFDLSTIEFKTYDLNKQSDYDFIKSEFLTYISRPIPVDPGIGGSTEPSPGGIACTQEAMVCPDGSYVGRDSDNNCAFSPCP